MQTSAVSSSSGSTSWQKSEQSDDKQSCSDKNRERKKIKEIAVSLVMKQGTDLTLYFCNVGPKLYLFEEFWF